MGREIMERDSIVEKVNAAILEEFDVEEADLSPDAKLGDDLGLDSLDGIDLVVAIERAFREQNVRIGETEVPKLQTLNSIYDYVSGQLSTSS
jgi:acyl carrier protein